VRDVRRDDCLDPWPRLRVFVVEFSEDEPIEGRRNSVGDLRAELVRFSGDGCGLDMALVGDLEDKSEGIFLCFFGRARTALGVSGTMRSASPLAALVCQEASNSVSACRSIVCPCTESN